MNNVNTKLYTNIMYIPDCTLIMYISGFTLIM